MINRLLLAIALLLVACQPPPHQPRSPVAPPSNQPQSPLAQPSHVWLPLLIWESTPPPPTRTPGPSCFPGAAEQEFYRLLVGDGRQQRPRLQCDPRLVAAAKLRAAAQPPAGLSHCDSFGICANVYARAAGCRLPGTYGMNGNNIESLTGGTASPAAAFESLARSPSHATHLFGQIPFFREQDHIGIALVEIPGWRWRWAWAIIIAPCDDGPR